MLKGLILSLAEQPENFLYGKNAPAQSVPGQEALPPALTKDGQETHPCLFCKQEHFLFSLKRNESWRYNSSVILGLTVDLSTTPWNITEKQFHSQLMVSKPSKASARQTLNNVSEPPA